MQGGFTNSGATGLSAFFAPLGALIFLNIRDARKIFYAFILLLSSISIYEIIYLDIDYIISRQFSVVQFMITGLSLLSITYFVLENFVSKINKYQEELVHEKEKSESLLLNILPESVARELKENGLSKAKGFASATVVFTDFVQFTTSAQLLTPGKLVEHLDIYFRAFDKIMEKHGLEKIKTIGDAYMCVGGVPVPNNKNPIDVLHAAVEMLRFVLEPVPDGIEKFEIRIGIHTGPVMAGVIGKNKFVKNPQK